MLPTRHLRLIGAAAALLLVGVNLATPRLHDGGVVAMRGGAGMLEGVLVWLPTCLVARAPSPARWAGVFLAVQGVGQLTFSLVAPTTLMATMGARGGFLLLAATNIVALGAATLIPDRLVSLPRPAAGHGASPLSQPASLAVLASVFLIAAFSIGLFAYLAPLAQQAGLSVEQLGVAVSVSLAMQIVGPALASVLSRRLPYYPVFAACVVVNVGVLALFASLPGEGGFVVASAAFGFFWLFFLPFQVPMAIDADPTRRSTMLLPGAQLLGASAGPVLCRFAVTDADARGALVVCGLCFLAAFAITSVQHVHLRLAARRVGA